MSTDAYSSRSVYTGLEKRNTGEKKHTDADRSRSVCTGLEKRNTGEKKHTDADRSRSVCTGPFLVWVPPEPAWGKGGE